MKFNKRKWYSITKIVLVWLALLFLITEFILFRIFFHQLPLKYSFHLTGPIQRLSQYTKEGVTPKDYIAIVGDSYAYGFGPWLYDNSGSWENPAYATQHILHDQTSRDFITFGYPGHGNFGTSISMIAEYNFFQNSVTWKLDGPPQLILFYFYEGNDLFNNLHEVMHRGFPILDDNRTTTREEIKDLIKCETRKLSDNWSWSDNFSTLNLFLGLWRNYYSRFIDDNKDENTLYGVEDKQNEQTSPYTESVPVNVMNISGKDHKLSFSDGPGLLLSEMELDLSLMILEQSIAHLRESFPESRIALVYIPSALSIYHFSSEKVRAGHWVLKDSGYQGNGLFKAKEAWDKSDRIRKAIFEITKQQGLHFVDPVKQLRKTAENNLLHGPRDPFHFNRKGYEAFAEAIIPAVKSLLSKTGN